MNILGLFSRTMQHNKYILFTTDRYSKLTRAIPTLKTTSPHKATLLWPSDCAGQHFYVSSHSKLWIVQQQILCNVMHRAWSQPVHHYGVSLTNQLSSRRTTKWSLFPIKITSRSTKKLRHLCTTANIDVWHPSPPQHQSKPVQSCP